MTLPREQTREEERTRPAVLTVHHWPDPHRGLGELRRVSRRQAVFTWDPGHRPELWLVEDCLPEIRESDASRFTPPAEVVEALGAHTVLPFPIPHDFTDGLRTAHRRRPESYLDPAVRAAGSTFASLPASVVEPAMERLRADLGVRCLAAAPRPPAGTSPGSRDGSGAHSTTASSRGALLRLRPPSSVTVTMSSMRTPKRPGR
ncbi:hypothetical protein ACFXGI_14845 [Streptomyces sp. NPDC059355]|uniref:hypothetical protein n=1 Tax=Streptomyces sp. NPDC059355 TaxID=3346811 RepID=UPI0036A35A90